MTGTPITRADGSRPAPVPDLVRASERADFRDRATGPAVATFVVLQVLIYLAAGAALMMRRPSALRRLAVLALGILAIPPLGFLSGLLPVDDLGVVGFVVILTAAGLAVGAAVATLTRRYPPFVAPVALAGLSLFVQLGDIVTGGRLQLNTVFGYSPIVAGRFAGFGNLSFAIVAATAIVVAGGVANLVRPRRTAMIAAVLVLSATVLLDGLPAFGSDVGGVLASVPAFAILVLLLTGRRIGWPRVALVGGGAVAVLTAFAVIDLLRPPAERTHLGRLVARVADDPAVLGDVLARKAETNVNILTSSIWTLVLPAAIAFLVVLLWRSPGFLRRLQDDVPMLRPTLVAGAVVGVLGFALNDSGVAVPGMMLGVFLPLVTWLLAATGAAADGRARDAAP